MINKHFFLHAHFDLPPALQPWHGETEPDPAAEPYANLYEQLFQTAIGPNTASPLLDEDGRILKFVNNFSYIGFDISPELFGWIERKHPRIYARILESDKQQRSRHGGHGGAIATAAVSLIAPLESDLDKRAAVLWGIADFRRRFDRAPEGFWLPENAADEKTLEILAEEGIQYTLLAPRHAEAVRPVDSTDEKDWQRVASETLGTTRPYRWRSQSDPRKTLAVFFYRTDLNPVRIYDKLPFALSTQTPLKTSREQVLDVGRRFANRMIDSFTANNSVEFSHVAVDGGLFGYSRLNGNRALTYSLDYLLREAPAKLTTGRISKTLPSAGRSAPVPRLAIMRSRRSQMERRLRLQQSARRMEASFSRSHRPIRQRRR